MVKVLFYNWTDYRSPRGGGVTVYLRSLLGALQNRPEVSSVFLSSGDVYSPFSSAPYIRPVADCGEGGCPAYQLVNSPVPAPGSLLAHNLHGYLDLADTRVLNLLRGFIVAQGGFDVIHFHNLEGLPLNVLRLKDYFPHTKIFFTLHNYFPFCPQVQLFQHHRDCSCAGKDKGRECSHCHNKKLQPLWFVEAFKAWFAPGSNWPQRLAPWLRYRSRRLSSYLLSVERQLNTPEIFTLFHQMNVAFLNRYTDKILAVSERVRDIALAQGIAPRLLEVAYIGTAYAGMQPLPRPLADRRDFTLAYLGYARAAKGFFFLLSALRSLPDAVAARLNLRIAARYVYEAVDSQTMRELHRRFRRVDITDGYRREDLPKLLSGVDLGIVPVIWEDNLPQVAIEMAAHGVPVLASSFGGASELSSSPFFRFRGGDKDDFLNRLQYIMEHREVLADYHRRRRPLMTMERHISRLLQIYPQRSAEVYHLDFPAASFNLQEDYLSNS